MVDIRAAMNDPRRRNLAVLTLVALVAVLLAFLGLAHQESVTARRDNPELFFPDLISRAGQIAQIRVRSAKGVVDVVFKPERGWVVASKDDYPASVEEVRQTVVGMAELIALERKTARADWLSYLDLVGPEQHGSGREITLLDDKGEIIASLIAGKTTDIGDPSGAVGLFVRRPTDAQSWLARSTFEPKTDPGDWLNKPVMSIDRSRIAEADVDPISGPYYVLRRDKPSDADFKLTEIPKGRELAYDSAPDGIAAAVVDFSFDDVQPSRNFDFSDPTRTARVVTKTFDGLTITVNAIQRGAEYWAIVSAEGTGAEAHKEALSIDAHASGWAYKLPTFKGVQFMSPLESILKPKDAPAAPAPAK
jgi:Domain of unknown function (DUF4340)